MTVFAPPLRSFVAISATTTRGRTSAIARESIFTASRSPSRPTAFAPRSFCLVDQPSVF